MSDRTWEWLARRDPYWAVLTDERFRGTTLDDGAREEFFETGRAHVEHVRKIIRERVDAGLEIRTALEFGCGVGRILPSLATSCERVVGVDVSPSMLERARRSLGELGIQNVELRTTDGEWLHPGERFDLVHCYLVLQHVAPERGLELVRRLVGTIEPGGVGVLHVTYRSKLPVPLAAHLVRWGMALGFLTPQMQMYSHDLGDVFEILQRSGVENLHVELTDHGYFGSLLVFRTPRRQGRARVAATR